jgi:hypothetical protein
LEFLRPLLAEGRRDNKLDVPLLLGPTLGNDQPGLNRLSQTNLVGKDRTLGQWGFQSEEGSIDLVRLHLYPRRRQEPGKCFVPDPFKGQPMGQKLAVVGREQ